MAKLILHDDLQRMLGELTDEDTAEALDHISWLASEADTLSDHEIVAMHEGDEEMAWGELAALD